MLLHRSIFIVLLFQFFHSIVSMQRFFGKVAIVTGGTSGIGKATAVNLAKLGAKVVVAGINEAEGHSVVDSILKEGHTAAFYRGDLTKEDVVKGMVDFTVGRYGRLDMACNNAGIELFEKTVDTTRANYDKVFNINVWGVLTCMKYQIPEMLKNGGGSIVNMASIAGLIGFPTLAIYDASKHAVQGLTKSVALEYAKQNIRINSIAPGLIDTPMADRITPIVPKSVFEGMTPMGRVGRPEEIAVVVQFLLDPANSYMTGQCVAVDGGWTAQ